MFSSIRNSVIAFFGMLTNLFEAGQNTTDAMKTASTVIQLQAEAWKAEQQLELNKLQKELRS